MRSEYIYFKYSFAAELTKSSRTLPLDGSKMKQNYKGDDIDIHSWENFIYNKSVKVL